MSKYVCMQPCLGWVGVSAPLVSSLSGRTTTFLCVKMSAISPRPESPGGQIPAGSSRTQCLLIGRLNESANWKLPAPRKAVTSVLKLAVLQHRGLCVPGTVQSLVARKDLALCYLESLAVGTRTEATSSLAFTMIPVHRDPRAGILPPCHQYFDHQFPFQIGSLFFAIKLHEKKLLPFPVSLPCTIKKPGPKKVQC